MRFPPGRAGPPRRKWRSALALAVAVLAGCGGSGDEGAERGIATSAEPAAPRLASGRSLPTTCPAGKLAPDATATFVAAGKAWAISPGGKHLACLFRVAEAGPFVWGPRGDRLLLDGLEIASLGKAPTRARDPVRAVSPSWGRPVGKAVVFVPDDGRRLLKARPGRTDYEDVTPVPGATYLEVAYHPSGLAFGFVVEGKGRQELWMSSNTGEKPVRLVHGRLHTTFAHLTFTVDGRALLFAARHRDGTWHVHRVELESPTQAFTLWTGDRAVVEIAANWRTELLALTTGPSCAERRAVFVDSDGPGGRPVLPDETRPTSVVGWLTNKRLLVAAGGCGQPIDLYSAPVRGAPRKLVTGVDAAAVRRPEPLPAPPLPTHRVGSGFA